MRRVVLVVAVLSGVLLPTADSLAEPGRDPVVLIPGWHGGASSFDRMIPVLEAAGIPVLDFDPARSGSQAMSFTPTADGQHISFIAGIVEKQIQDALARAGYHPNQHVDIVGYSMGGLLARFLIEHPGADIDSFSTDRGWFGDGTPDVARGWAERVDDLVMLGTPNHGTFEAWVPGTIGGFGRWNASGGDMRPGSPFLRRMGVSEPAGERYVDIGGNPWYLPFPRWDYDGDGVAHGYDGLVPAESPFLAGDEHYLVPVNHSSLVSDAEPVNLVVQALGRSVRAPGPGGGERNLAGAATVRLEHAAIATDHDWATADEYRFDVSIDADPGVRGASAGDSGDSFVPVGEISYRRDAPFTQDWGNAGPTVGPFMLPGTSPRLDVRVDVWERDPWRHQVVTTATFPDVMLSDDRDGMDYYEAIVPVTSGTPRAPGSGGRHHVLRISLNGVSARPPV